jgi:hypothetical protein
MDRANYIILFVLIGLMALCLYHSTENKMGFQNCKQSNYDYFQENRQSPDYKSIKDMIQLPNKDPNMRTSSLIVPTYSQNNYIPSPNNQVLNVNQINFLNSAQPEENRKQTKMEVLNLCYQDVINDSINIQQAPKNMYITP